MATSENPYFVEAQFNISGHQHKISYEQHYADFNKFADLKSQTSKFSRHPAQAIADSKGDYQCYYLLNMKLWSCKTKEKPGFGDVRCIATDDTGLVGNVLIRLEDPGSVQSVVWNISQRR